MHENNICRSIYIIRGGFLSSRYKNGSWLQNADHQAVSDHGLFKSKIQSILIIWVFVWQKVIWFKTAFLCAHFSTRLNTNSPTCTKEEQKTFHLLCLARQNQYWHSARLCHFLIIRCVIICSHSLMIQIKNLKSEYTGEFGICLERLAPRRWY